MAEGKEESKSSEESVKLFVGQVPKHMTEPELLAMFKDFALVDEVNIIKDKATRASRGCCFVICPSREEADKAVNACHNKRTLPGASSPLQVKYADGELERLEHKLFIGMLPKNVSEVEISALFSKYGTIKDLQILRGSQQTSKGCAFLKYETKEQALTALEAINGKHKMEYFGSSSGIQPRNPVGFTKKSHFLLATNLPGSSVPLVVKWADTEKERQARRAQKAQSQASNVPHTDSQHPSLFGALPMSYVPPYNGYGYQAPVGYGLMPYRMPPMQSQHGYHNMMPHMNQGNALRPDLGPNMNPRNYHVPPASYVGSYPAVPGLQHPMAYPTGMISPRPMNTSPGSVSPASGNNNHAASSGASKNSGGQAEGPPGANLFIYHIPQEFGDQELATAFQPFGRVLSAKVFVDKATGVSKCFGFVSYDTPEAAQSAISMMNGCQLGGKKLKVQLKRDNKQGKPY
ncbi:RNA-binding protein BRN1 [Glycine soja]